MRSPKGERKPDAGTTAEDPGRKTRRRIAAALLLLLAAGVTVYAVYFAYRRLTVENSRFSLRSIVISGGGFYEKHPEILRAECGLDGLLQHQVNIFRINPEKVQSRVESLPKVKRCIIRSELPDTLHMEIIEYLPRAVIKQSGEKRDRRGVFALAIDEDARLLPADRCVPELLRELPVIGNLPSDVELSPGKTAEELLPALQLIMLTVRNYGDLRVREISLRDPEDMEFLVDYGWGQQGTEPVRVVMPRDFKSMPLRLTALHSELYRNRPRRDSHRKWRYKLSYDGQIAIQPL